MDAFLSPGQKNEPQEEKEEMERSFKRYRELISSLPKERSWMADHMYQYQGYWYDIHHCIGVMAVQQHFVAKSTDVLLVSTPKSGTVWLKAILFAIMNRNRYNMSDHPLLSTNPHHLVPFLETRVYVENPFTKVKDFPDPRLLATHIPFDSLSDSIKSSGCRIVYICRDPKDVLVSFWRFMNKLRDENLPPLSLQEAYELFSKGVSGFGPYWDHVKGYKKASVEWPERLFFITFEDMKKDTLVNLKRLAEFLGQPITLEEEDKGVAEEILELCSFENLKDLEVNKEGSVLKGKITNDVFFRKGMVGDWKNHLSTQMIEHLDKITEEKLPNLFPPLVSI